jgi:hypothetical protein
MRVLKSLVAFVFCLSLLGGCEGEKVKTNPKDVTIDTGKNPGTGKQGKIESARTPKID